MSDSTILPAAETPSAKPSRRWPVIVAGLCLVAGAAVGMGWLLNKNQAPAPQLVAEKLGMSRPDGLLETHSLSQLPKEDRKSVV